MKKLYEGVYAVVVTYADRYHLLKQVVKGALDAGCSKVIIVDNNSKCKTKNKKLKSKKVDYVLLKENTGSAGGYKAGLQYAMKDKKCNSVWLLDDDNVPDKNALHLLLYWRWSHKLVNNNNDVAAFSLRHYDEAFKYKTKGELELKYLEKDIMMLNSFCYFSYQKLFNMVCGLFKKRKPNYFAYYGTVAGGYGGLLLSRETIEKVGYPNEDMFTYFDDIEYTYRMYKSGTSLILIPDSKINDIDMTLTNENVKTYFSVYKILENIQTMNDKKLWYGYRNRVILEKNFLVTNKFMYGLNRFTFYMIIHPLAKLAFKLLFNDTYKINHLKSAVHVGEIWKW